MKILLVLITMCSILLSNPLNVRTNNAGNIKYIERNNWVGQTGQENGFAVFDTKEHGLRAMKIVIKANIRATNNVDAFVVRYAGEPNETIHTQHLINYATAIKDKLGRDFILETDTELLAPLMVYLEGGKEAYKYFYGDKEWHKNLTNQDSCNLQKTEKVKVGMSVQQTKQHTLVTYTKTELLEIALLLKTNTQATFQQKKRLLKLYLNIVRPKTNGQARTI